MEITKRNENTEKQLIWNKPEVRVITISFDTAQVKTGSGPDLLDQE